MTVINGVPEGCHLTYCGLFCLLFVRSLLLARGLGDFNAKNIEQDLGRLLSQENAGVAMRKYSFSTS